jgi:hypothetical protein
MTRLDRFLDVDDSARDQAARISTAAGFGSFLIARFLLAFDGKNLAYIVIAVIVFTYLARLWWYCNIATPEAVPFSRTLFPRRFAMAAAAAIFAFIIAPPAIVEAAVLNRRIRELANRPTLTPDQANGIADALATASTSGLTLSPKILAIVRDAIKSSEPDSAVARAANALINYDDDIRPPSLINPPKTAAQRAFLEGTQHSRDARHAPPDFREAAAAISALSLCISLSRSENSLRTDALLERAGVYTSIGKPTEALADIQLAEDYGALDLPRIISIETFALMMRGQPEDLRKVVPLVSLGLQIKPPKWLLAADPRMETIYRVELIERRAAAQYLLGDFAKSAEDARRGLELAPLHAQPVSSLFAYLISSYLELGQTAAGLSAAREWQARNGDPRSLAVQAALNRQPSDIKAALGYLSLVR